MDMNADKTKIMTNNSLYKEAGAKVGNSRPFQILGDIICDEGSTREVLFRAAQTMAALARIILCGQTRKSE